VRIQLALQMVSVAGGQTGSLGHGFELETAGQRGGGTSSGGRPNERRTGVQRPDCMETVEDACASSSAYDFVGILGHFMSVCSRCVLTLQLDFSRASNSILSSACPAIGGPPVGGLPQLSVVCPVAARLTTPALGPFSYGGCASMAAYTIFTGRS
jgi:hypothetical protein